ncbi:hypothetical protein ACR6C2_00695 [Streptomyces sp. INA 01156]
MPHHALEITLTRPPNPAELDAACRRMPLAANCDTTRLMALVPPRPPNGPPTGCADASKTGSPST